MKNKYLMVVMLLGFTGIFTMQSCTKDESPTPVVYKAFTTPVMSTTPAVRADGTILFSGGTVDLVWASSGAAGAAQSWTVNFGTTDPPALYKDKVSSQKLTVPVVDGQTYYWSVVIVDANGIKTTSPVHEFTAVSGTNPEMNVGLTTTTDVKTSIGLDLAADKVADLRLLILKKSDMSVVSIVDDGYAAEDYSDFGTLPDGDYVIGVDLLATINAGDFNKAISLSLSLQFDQLGITNTKLDFPNVMTNVNPCSLYRTYLANVNKNGAIYTITSAVSYMVPDILTWKGDDATYASTVTTTASCTSKTMKGLNSGWMLDFWGETIVSGGTCTYTISGNTITIPLQKFCKTTYKGAAQPEYSISGTGTIDNSGAYPIYTIHYDLIQSGASIIQWCFDNGYWGTNYLEAVITTNPAGKKSVETARPTLRPKH